MKNRSVVDDAVASDVDLESWSQEFDHVVGLLDAQFRHPKSRRHVRQYLAGLLAPLEKKNGWTIAEHTGEKEPKALQRFLNLATWDADRVRDMLRDYVLGNLGDPRAVVVADDTGFPKKGTKSAGVQRQYSGTLGRTDNCQVGTFLAYVTSDRDRVLVDRELYVPQTWIDDPDRCGEAGIPADHRFATKPTQVQTMLDRLLTAEVPFAWFTADEFYGDNPGLRAHLHHRGVAYVMAISKDTTFIDSRGNTRAVNNAAARLDRNKWQRRACGIGAKGFRVYDWTLIDSADPNHPYLIRRSTDDGELAYYRCYNPRREGFGELVRVAGTRWPIEECYECGKGDVGLDHYQVRLYPAWYRHVTLAMLAHAFLAVLASRSKKGTHRLWTTTPETAKHKHTS